MSSKMKWCAMEAVVNSNNEAWKVGEMRGTSRGLDPDSVVRPGEMRTGKKFEAELARSRGEPIADPGTSRMPHGTKTMDILKKGWKPDRYRRGGR